MTPSTESNPFLDLSGPPRYDVLRAEQAEPALLRLVAESDSLLERLLAAAGPRTWDGFCRPLDEAEERIERVWGALSNLEATLGTDELRAAYRRCQEIVTRHASDRGQDERLYRALREVAEGTGAAALDAAQRKILGDQLRDFRLAGVHLAPEAKQRAREIRMEIARLGAQFADHATDDALAFRLVVDRAEDVAGLPSDLVAAARAQALADDPSAPEDRWSFGLDGPTYVAFMTHQRNRALRRQMAVAWLTRGCSPARDNGPLVRRILALRRELAGLLGFGCYAELSLVPKMARSPQEVRAFLLDLADRALPRAREETAALLEIARREDGVERLERYDLAYYREKLRSAQHGFSQEELRPYFPLPRVVEGLGRVLGRLYGLTLRDRTAEGVLPTWHADVRVLELADGGRPVGHVLFDPCARQGKRAGAWVASCVARVRRADGSVQAPVVHLVCNFPAPVGGRPALLAHEDVRTLFHEFGHALHNLLSTVDHRAASGVRGVPWDGVEFPSQFHENWIWDEEPLAMLGGHVETGAPVPVGLVAKLRAARDFLGASDLVRQAELALVDLELHADFDPARDDVRTLVESVRRRVAVVPAMPEDRFENSFLHIFQGGYAAGYYGYKWAEVLAADAFGRFLEEGLFSASAARDYRTHVLEKGGSEDFLDLFVRFRGRAPDPQALLRQAGVA